MPGLRTGLQLERRHCIGRNAFSTSIFVTHDHLPATSAATEATAAHAAAASTATEATAAHAAAASETVIATDAFHLSGSLTSVYSAEGRSVLIARKRRQLDVPGFLYSTRDGAFRTAAERIHPGGSPVTQCRNSRIVEVRPSGDIRPLPWDVPAIHLSLLQDVAVELRTVVADVPIHDIPVCID